MLGQRGARVTNKKTLYAFERFIQTDWVYNGREYRFPEDYLAYAEEKFANPTMHPEEIRNAILAMYQEPNRKPVKVYRFCDAGGCLVGLPYWDENRRLFYGDFLLQLSLYSCNFDIAEPAESCAEFLRRMGSAYQTINGMVMLGSDPNITAHSTEHRRRFGQDPYEDGSHIAARCRPIEWYQTHYLLGAEWCNLISPGTLQLLPRLRQEIEQYPDLYMEPLRGGGALVRMHRPLLEVDIADLIPVKRLLYDALYPGMSMYSARRILEGAFDSWMGCPRREWARIPIFPEEIFVSGENIVFAHRKWQEWKKQEN